MYRHVGNRLRPLVLQTVNKIIYSPTIAAINRPVLLLQDSLTRSTSTGSGPQGQFENEHAHRIVENLPQFRHITIDEQPVEPDVPKDVSKLLSSYDTLPIADDDLNPESVLHVLDQLASLGADDALIRYNPFCIFLECVCDVISDFNDKQLLTCVTCLNALQVRNPSTRHFQSVHFRIGKEISEQIEKHIAILDKNFLFSVLELYYKLQYRHIPRQLFYKLEESVDLMSKDEVIFTLYYVNFARQARLQFRQMLEKKVSEFVNDLSVDELAVACLGFHKSRHVITSHNILEACMTQLYQNAATVSELSLAAVLKAVYGATNRSVLPLDSSMKSYSQNLLTALLPRMNELSITTCLHLFQISLSLKQLSHNMVEALCDKVRNDNISMWRLKDLSWLLLQLGMFQANLAEKDVFYRKLVREILSPRRKAEAAYNRFPQCAVRALIGLCYLEIFPYEMINEVLSPSYLQNINERMLSYDIRRDVFQLDQTVRLECPDYRGNLLDDKFITEVLSHENITSAKLPHEKLLAKQTKRDKILLDLQSHLELLFNGALYAEICFVLPYIQTADVLFEVDEDNNIVSLSDWSDDYITNGHKRIVLLLAAPNNYHVYQTDYGFSRKLLGNYVLKRRHIQKTGYTVIEIPYFEWNQARAGKPSYLRRLLAPHVNLG